MLTDFLRWTFGINLLISGSFSIKIPKHDLVYYYKTHDSVFLKNPSNHSTLYGIYVAGETVYIDIPQNIANVSEIVNWKVINTDVSRLMFVYNNKPRVLINRTIIREMKFSGNLSDSIIAFGDNEALHVPTILNLNANEPNPKWNCIDLLHFNVKSEKVSVIRSLKWRNDSYWRFFKEWKMTDNIYFDKKMFILIKRTKASYMLRAEQQEIAIIRLDLTKGNDLFSTAAHIYFDRPEFLIGQIINTIFVLDFKAAPKSNRLLQFHSTILSTNDSTIRYYNYTIANFLLLLELSSGDYPKNVHPWGLLAAANISASYNFHYTKETHRLHFLSIPYPFNLFTLNFRYIDFNLYRDCLSDYFRCRNLTSYTELVKVERHINKKPFGVYYLTTTSNINIIQFIEMDLCWRVTNCIDCILYGLSSFNCIWSNSKCKKSNTTVKKSDYTANYCFKIIDIHPKAFKLSSTKTLKIQSEEPLDTNVPDKSLVIEAGQTNNCDNIKRDGSNISCELNLNRAGTFIVTLSLQSYKYSDTSILRAHSNQSVVITLEYSIIFIIMSFLGLLFGQFFLLFILCLRYNKLARFKNFSLNKKLKGLIELKSELNSWGKRASSPGAYTQSKSTIITKSRTSMLPSWTDLPFVLSRVHLAKQSSQIKN